MKNLKKILSIGILSSTLVWGSGAVAQRSFLFPSASFFSPRAAYLQSEDDPGLFMALKLMTQHKTLDSYITPEFIDENTGDFITLLAPTNEAFDKLPADTKAKLEDPDKLEQLLKYHLVVGEIAEEDIKRRSVATSLDKTSVAITGVQEGNEIGVKINDAKALEAMKYADGVIIPIDGVLIPPGF